MMRQALVEWPKFDDYGLSAFSFRCESKDGRFDDLRTAASHTHLEIELHFVEAGALTVDFAGREERVGPGELLAFWGGIPHRGIDPEPPVTTYHVAHVPIVNVMTWASSSSVLDRLLEGDLLKSTSAPPLLDLERLTFARWSSDLEAADPRLRAAVRIEIEARLLRLLGSTTSIRPALARQHPGAAAANLAAQAIHYSTRHFVEPITVDDVAQAVGRTRDHLMASFRRVCGLTLWEYVTRLRLSEAQRLLTTTQLPILAVCHRSGFSSVSRMYDAFHHYCGQTPAAYRQQMQP